MCKKKEKKEKEKKDDDKKKYIRNLASVFKHKKYNMGHYLTLCTHIYICNTQIIALETEKVEKITQDSDVNQWPQWSSIRKQKCFNDILRVTGSNI